MDHLAQLSIVAYLAHIAFARRCMSLSTVGHDDWNYYSGVKEDWWCNFQQQRYTMKLGGTFCSEAWRDTSLTSWQSREKTHRGNIEGQGLSHASSCNVWRPAAQKGIGEREFEVPSNTQAIRSSVRQYLARGNRAPFWHVWYVASVVGGLPQKYTHERKFFFFFLLSGCFGSQ